MEFSAIHHNMDKKYCYALEMGKFLIRIKTKKNDIDKITLYYQDKYIRTKVLDTRQNVLMKKVTSDNYSDYYEAEIEFDVVCLRYYFGLKDATGKVAYYGNYEFFTEKIEDIERMFDCPQTLREEEIFLVPDWAKNKVVYQIFPSRFASSKEIEEEIWYQRPINAKENLYGDLKGIQSRLVYLKQLGVDIIYMTPIFQSDSIHKYDTIDYYKIDPCFGTEEDLKNLVEDAHKMGMRVMLDGVFNHTSPKFFAFADIQSKKEDSVYKEWYYLEGFPLEVGWGKKPNYKSFGYHGGMPKLNLQNPDTQQYFIEVGRYWIEKCHIDGWRLDVGDEISHKFWKTFREEIKKINPDVFIVGEVWHYAGDFLEGDEWDSVMNYPFYFSVMDFVAKEKITASKFLGNIGYLRGNLHKKVFPVLWNLIDSHDTPRFLNLCGEKKEKLKLAAALQLLLPGMPVIYYGDEFGMTGGQDPDCRRGMLWDIKYQDQELYQWYRNLICIRKEVIRTTQDGRITVEADDEKGLIIITKELEKDQVIICFHGKDGEAELPAYSGVRNRLTEELFTGIIGPYETVVLYKEGVVYN